MLPRGGGGGGEENSEEQITLARHSPSLMNHSCLQIQRAGISTHIYIHKSQVNFSFELQTMFDFI